MNTKIMVLIVSPPGDLQIGLQALLTVHLDADVLVVGEGNAALTVIERQCPAMVIIDEDLGEETAVSLLHHIKSNQPDIICITIANDEQGRQQFTNTHTDLVVIKGLSGAKLITEIKNLRFFGNSRG